MKPNSAETLRFSAYGRTDEDIPKVHWLYFPIHYDKFITVCIENEYKLWGEVFELVMPFLAKREIGVVSLAKGKEAVIRYGQNTSNISLGGAAYLMENALCHVCAADWSLTLAQHNGISPVFAKTASDELVYNRMDYQSGVEDIEKPEALAKAIIERLGLKEEIRVETLFKGDCYGDTFIELIPDFNIKDANINPTMNIGVRCDLHENWNFVREIINKGVNPTVIAKTLPPKQILPFLRGVAKMNFWVSEEFDIERLKVIEDLGIPYTLLSRTEDISDIKYRLFDFKPIKTIEPPSQIFLDKLKSFSYDTRIKSKRLLVSKDGTFLSVYHWKQNLPAKETKGSLILEGASNEDFINESDLFIYYKVKP